MSQGEVITVHSVVRVGDFKRVLDGTSHHAFPVVNQAENVIGLIPKKMIVNLLILKAFYHTAATENLKGESGQTEHAGNQQNDGAVTGDEQAGKLLPLPNLTSGKWRSTRSKSIIIVEDAETHQKISTPTHRGRYSTAYDEVHGWPATPEDELIDWSHFCMNIYSDEVSAEYVLQKIIPQYQDEWIDLRPYMIESPFQISLNATLEDALELFYLLHLRHLIVTDPHNGKIAGIVTRKDIFVWMEPPE